MNSLQYWTCSIFIFTKWIDTSPSNIDQLTINLNVEDKSSEPIFSKNEAGKYDNGKFYQGMLSIGYPRGISKKNTEVRETTAVKAIADGNARFGQRLYENMRNKEEGSNLIVSPYSVSNVMAMVSMGARGDTLREIREGMNFPSHEELVAGYSDLFDLLSGTEKFSLKMADQLFIQAGYHLLDDFLELLEESFHALVTETNFAASEEARKLINNWVELKTKEKIRDTIPEGVVNNQTRMILVNVIYFKGDWTNTFEQKSSFFANFHVEANSVVQAKMMHIHGINFKMTNIKKMNAKAIELPYKGDRISMYILLPNDKFGLAAVETKLSTIKLHTLFSEVDTSKERKIDLIVPKFKIEKTIPLKNHLKNLGMGHIFKNSSDFSGISSNTDVYVSAVNQKAIVEVNEEGSEPAMVKALEHKFLSLPLPSPNFICDHPFIFFIKDKLTNILLFMGRVVDPSYD